MATSSAAQGPAFVPNGFWPAAYDNTYLFADYDLDMNFDAEGVEILRGAGEIRGESRTTRQYADEIWGASPVPISPDPL